MKSETENAPFHPIDLSLVYCGFLGSQGKVRLDGTEVKTYEFANPGAKATPKSSNTPSETQWQSFRDTLDELGVWKWRKKYENPGVMDGAGWQFVATYSDANIESKGDNNYPGENGNPNESPEWTVEFEKLCDAVEVLTGGFRITGS